MTSIFKYKIDQIRVGLSYDDNHIISKICRETALKKDLIVSHKIIKRSIDARKKPQYILSVEISTTVKIRKKTRNIHIIESQTKPLSINVIGPQKTTPVVVGAGPAGLWAAWYLAKAGLKPILIERGEEATDRKKSVNQFWNKGLLNNESNVLFGEGGAGLFSDGKLTARSKDRGRVKMFLDLLVKHGASPEILIDTHPHIGSDLLMKIVPSIRQEIIDLGGTVNFSTRLDDIEIVNNEICSIETSKGKILTNNLILAIGHSARDTYRMLSSKGITINSKSFAIGIRLELPQEHINNNRYRCYDKRLGSASFRLTRKETNSSRACYSFCMCPGGQVISCANSDGMLTSNGMSYSKRSLPSGNAAFLVPVLPSDHIHLQDKDILTGIAFQEELERKAFTAGGSDFSLPASDLTSFINNSVPNRVSQYCSPHRIKTANLNQILPKFISDSLKVSIPAMLSQLGSPNPENIMLYGTETRSSSPIQLIRDENGQSVSLKGLYPAGEGAGYAGGIVSSGIDGLKAAESVVNSY